MSFSDATLADAEPAPRRSSLKVGLRSGAQLKKGWADLKILHMSHQGEPYFEQHSPGLPPRSPVSPLGTPPDSSFRNWVADGNGGVQHCGILRAVDVKVEQESLALESGEKSSKAFPRPDDLKPEDESSALETSSTSKEGFPHPDDLLVDDDFYALAPGETPDGGFYPFPSRCFQKPIFPDVFTPEMWNPNAYFDPASEYEEFLARSQNNYNEPSVRRRQLRGRRSRRTFRSMSERLKLKSMMVCWVTSCLGPSRKGPRTEGRNMGMGVVFGSGDRGSLHMLAELSE
ncbi:hypothetical protein BCR34DRAFT_135963 [Clohesyomyces aquaticus]|uniref:Uncharacterized protein n=1 Tax=Clohesyomyces aquaticus TaxID=1231657 RepID=A0A1Y2ABE8_9PLEO|nr:hypothetical protein BCR34DRAFT_135963 [Clohesyomyces aquaticus]